MQKNKYDFDFDFLFLIFLMLILGTLLFRDIQAREVRTLKLNQQTMGTIRVTAGRTTILSFPSHPSKVLLGSQGAFAVEYIENDIAIAALRPNARSNVFVYLDGRRFGFDLLTVPAGGDEVVFVRDLIQPGARLKVQVR